MTNRERFIETYTEALRDAVTNHPEVYVFPISEVPVVVERMVKAIDRKGYNKDGPAFRATCKKLSIPYTYKGIEAYWNG